MNDEILNRIGDAILNAMPDTHEFLIMVVPMGKLHDAPQSDLDRKNWHMVTTPGLKRSDAIILAQNAERHLSEGHGYFPGDTPGQDGQKEGS